MRPAQRQRVEKLLEEDAKKNPPSWSFVLFCLAVWSGWVFIMMVGWNLWKSYLYGASFWPLLCEDAFWITIIVLAVFLTAFVVRILKWTWFVGIRRRSDFRFWTRAAFSGFWTRIIGEDNRLSKRTVAIVIAWSTAFIVLWFTFGTVIERSVLEPLLSWLGCKP